MFRFVDPWYLSLLLVVPFLFLWYFKRKGMKPASIKFSKVDPILTSGSVKNPRYRDWLFIGRLLALSFFIMSFARPQSGARSSEVETEGIDIILAMDVSTSMLAEDLKPNRIQAAQSVAKEFIKGRQNDRLGMVIFARQSFLQCPLTLDYGVLLTFLDKMEVATPDWDGTAIGMGIANAVSRLKDSKAKSKVIILLTDGVNNAGEIDPITSAQMAKTFGIRIYTIGAGTRGTALYPIDDPIFGKRYVSMPVEIDEGSLQNIAEITEGRYFRATDEHKLSEIYNEIGQLEKTKIQVKEFTRYNELYIYFLVIGLFGLLTETILSHTRYRKIP